MAFGAAMPSYSSSDNINTHLPLNSASDQCLQGDGVKCSDWTFLPDMRTVVSDVSIVVFDVIIPFLC